VNNIDPKGGKIECYDVKEYNTEDHLVGAATRADIAFLRAIQRKMATQLNAWKKKNPSKPFPFIPKCVPANADCALHASLPRVPRRSVRL